MQFEYILVVTQDRLLNWFYILSCLFFLYFFKLKIKFTNKIKCCAIVDKNNEFIQFLAWNYLIRIIRKTTKWHWKWAHLEMGFSRRFIDLKSKYIFGIDFKWFDNEKSFELMHRQDCNDICVYKLYVMTFVYNFLVALPMTKEKCGCESQNMCSIYLLLSSLKHFTRHGVCLAPHEGIWL